MRFFLRLCAVGIGLTALSTTVVAFAPLRSSTTTSAVASSFSTSSSSSNKLFMVATEAPVADNISQEGEEQQQQSEQRRALGSQELLMLPRQYGPGDDTFPQMNHVTAAVLSATPNLERLTQAVAMAMAAHPLLRAHVTGDGEPNKRIDLFQMVREGEPNPCTFVVDDDNDDEAAETMPTAQQVVSAVDVITSGDDDDDDDALAKSWQASFRQYLDDGSWCDPYAGPLWKLELHRTTTTSYSSPSTAPCALVLAFNHAISDQSSANRLVDEILYNLAKLEEGELSFASQTTTSQAMPVSLEDSVLGKDQRWKDVGVQGLELGTLAYVAGKAAEGLKNPVILPEASTASTEASFGGALTLISGKAAGGQDETSQERRSSAHFATLSDPATAALLAKCRAKGLSISHALVAAATLTASDFVTTHRGADAKERYYKVLHSLDMRRFGEKLDKGETVACMAGSFDIMQGPLKDGSGEALRSNPTADRLDDFWKLAKESQQQTQDFMDSDGPKHAVRVFDFAMSISDLNNLVHLTSQSKDTQGRAYSAGVTNVGVYERQATFPRQGSSDDKVLKLQHGPYRVEEIYFATPHTRSGCLYPVSCLTVDGAMKCTFHSVAPIVSAETNAEFASAFMDVLELAAGTKDKSDTFNGVSKMEESKKKSVASFFKDNAPPLLAAIIGAIAVATHTEAWSAFFDSVEQMKAQATPEDAAAALNFWIFFAVGHVILQPILWISDVMHATPGPKLIGDELVPALFLAGNAVAIAALTLSKQIRNTINVAALFAFFAYIGAGLDGMAGLGDYNLAIDDSYKGQVVRGCPAYDEVRQPSMDGFDLNKYQGKWYEQKFHDWTQFKEVYDTTLDIRLTEGGAGWIDDFAVKGPAPDAAPKSWWASPVANGAHYFLFGRVDANDPPGILREKGFGVEFPNYIVDVKKDQSTGEYTEAIQFQCLERGGVRVFEGINFMSRNPTMTPDEMKAMHSRAEKAGMFPYGASPEQMHSVARRPVDAPPIDNNWQAMWRAIGLDSLLELLTESIEDGGRAQ